MRFLTGVVWMAFGWYSVVGCVVGLISLLLLLSDRDAIRVHRIGALDAVTIFAIICWMWPIQVWDWFNNDGPWQG